MIYLEKISKVITLSKFTYLTLRFISKQRTESNQFVKGVITRKEVIKEEKIRGEEPLKRYTKELGVYEEKKKGGLVEYRKSLTKN